MYLLFSARGREPISNDAGVEKKKKKREREKKCYLTIRPPRTANAGKCFIGYLAL